MLAKRNVYTTIILIITILMIVFFNSCNDGSIDNKNETTIDSGGQAETTTQAETGRLEISDEIEDEDMGEREIVIVNRPRADFKSEVWAEADMGEIINDTIYQRNKDIEERFNVKIVSVDKEEPSKDALITVKADTPTYDIVMEHAIILAGSSMQRPYYDWNTIPTINLNKPWYLKDTKDQLSIGGKSYIVAGEYCLSIMMKTYCMFFNKQIIKDNSLDDPYQLVMDGKWTIDKCNDMIKDMYKDVDSDGTRNDQDFYGLCTNIHSSIVTYTYAADMSIMKMNADKIPEVSIFNDKTYTLIDKVYNLIIDNPGTFYGTWGEDTPIYTNNRALFRNYMFEFIIALRENESDFGIIPYPKLNETQQNYYTMADGGHSLMAIPITVREPEKVGKIIEALNAESWKKVIPVYYEIALKQKYSRDSESAQVLDTILDGRVFDFGYLYDNWKGYAFFLQHLLEQKTKDFASYTEKIKDQAEKNYSDVISMLTE